MFYGIYILALPIFVISATSEILRPRRSSDLSGRNEGSGIVCTKAGKCTCLFESLRVTVKCTSVGDKFDKVASELPKRTTHL